MLARHRNEELVGDERCYVCVVFAVGVMIVLLRKKEGIVVAGGRKSV